jgi:transcriptional regulator with XRE-family HTH domain
MRLMTRSLGETIRTVRETRGLTRAQLATRCGISLRHLASIEAGLNFSVAVFLAILRELQDPALLCTLARVAIGVDSPRTVQKRHHARRHGAVAAR